MGFKPFKTQGGHVPAWEYHPAGAITPKVGMALAQSGGNMTVATGTTAPTYISMEEHDAALTAGTNIAVIRVSEEDIFETENSAAFSAINRGDKVTLADGLKVTATKTGGVAEVVDFDDAAVAGAGGKVYVRFPSAAAAEAAAAAAAAAAAGTT